MIMAYSTLTLDGMRKMIWDKSDPLQQTQRHKNSKEILWKIYNLYIIIIMAYMKVYSLIYGL